MVSIVDMDIEDNLFHRLLLVIKIIDALATEF